MARSGRKHVSIQAPIVKIKEGYVWVDRFWPDNFFKWIKQEKIKFTEIKMKNQKLTLYFSTAKECTMFGLKYDREKQKEIFRTKEWS
jgi:hypothetical protein|tara:strand:- start:1775 stop:2035 length:261 start_codon:yes stop_codon:yes gene_type:complete